MGFGVDDHAIKDIMIYIYDLVTTYKGSWVHDKERRHPNSKGYGLKAFEVFKFVLYFEIEYRKPVLSDQPKT